MDTTSLANLLPPDPSTRAQGSAKTAKTGSKAEPASQTFSAYARSREDLALRLTSKDGDVLELRASVDVEAGYTKESATRASGNKGGKPAGAELEAADSETTYAPGDAKEWVRQVKKELGEQQARLFEALLKGYSQDDDKNGPKIVDWQTAAENAGNQEKGSIGDTEYWNAENTSDRIVAFATGFAALHGADPQAFAEKIKRAVGDGFDQAHAITGDLPGEAGKIFRDTKEQVFAKLDKWLEDWQTGAYNHEDQTA